MLKTKNLTKIFTTEEVETTALNNVNAEIQDGEFVAIMGPSGCGKSTFLHITLLKAVVSTSSVVKTFVRFFVLSIGFLSCYLKGH